MKYKILQSLQINLERDLNEQAENGYEWVCKLFAWDTTVPGGKTKLITYLLSLTNQRE